MNNKKGFTLIELISVVAILTIVSTLAVLSVSRLSQTIKDKQKDNLLQSLKVSAKKYLNDTGIKKVFIDSLIKEGYVEGDKIVSNRQIIVDPTDPSQELNCYYFDFTTDDEGTISSEPQYDGDSCKVSIIADALINIVYNNEDIPNNWFKTSSNNVLLKVVSLNPTVVTSDMLKNNSTWTTPLAPDVFAQGETYSITVPNNGYIERTYSVLIRTDEGKDYTTTRIVKIDNSFPAVNNIRVSNADTWKNAKYIYANVEDTGSGLKKYAITDKTSDSDISSSEWKNISGDSFQIDSNDVSNKVTKNGTYYIYVQDAIGHVTKSSAIVVKKIDNTPPTCDHKGDNYYWTNTPVSITWTCANEPNTSENSPCATYITNEYNNMETKTYSYTIEDEAGNTASCKETASIKSDMQKPTIGIFRITSNKEYNSIDASYSIVGNDYLSGIKAYCLSNSNSYSGCTWQSSSTGNITLGTQEGTGHEYTRYAFIKDNAGNISDAAIEYYTLYTKCSNYKKDLNGSFSSCSNTCGGTKSRPYIDEYLNAKCDFDEVVSCCDDETKTNCGEWICDICSKECDEGTCTKAHRICTVKTSCSNYCGTTEEPSYYPGTTCNNGPCCTPSHFDDYCKNQYYYEYNNCDGEEYAGSCTYSGPYCIDGEEMYLYCDPDNVYCYEKNDYTAWHRKSSLTLGYCEEEEEEDEPSTKTMYFCRVDGFTENGVAYGNTCIGYGGLSCYWAVKSYANNHTAIEVSTTMQGSYYVVASGKYEGGKIYMNCLKSSSTDVCYNGTCSG